jgi:hypothetical protein
MLARDRESLEDGRLTSGHRRSMGTFDCRVDVNGEEWPFALLRGRRARTSRHAPLYLCIVRRPRFGVRQLFVCCKSLIGRLYFAVGGHSVSFLPAAEPARRRISAISRRALLDDLGKVARCSSLPSSSRRAFFWREVVRPQTDLTAGIAEPPAATDASLKRTPDLLKVQLNDFVRPHDARLTLITSNDG